MRHGPLQYFECVALAFVAACSSAPPPKPQVPADQTAKMEAQLRASFEAFNNRKRYPALTPKIIQAIPDVEIEQAILDLVDCRVQRSGKSKREVLSALPPGFRAVDATWWIEAEVSNGGFNQYFWNSAGEFAQDAVEGFDLIGAPALARLTERAIAIRANDEARMAKLKQQGSWEAFSESYEGNALNQLDAEFFEANPDLSQTRLRFIRGNPELFRARCD